MSPAELLLAHYPCLRAIPPEAFERDCATLSVIDAPERTPLFSENEPCRGFPFVVSGQVRVARGSVRGREVELYRVHAGEICVVSTACLLGSTAMTAHGTTAETTRLIVVGRDLLVRWTAHEPVRMFLLSVMADRMAELMELVEAVAFHRVDQRLAHALLGRGRIIHATHQQLADEVGTAREMVSRLLKRFADQGMLRLGREQIEIVDAASLRAAASDPE
ncbi:MAG TPA: Crp/Fnr family transcriptional regulator [Quisquiliibacterium sp.]|nr:Crp/Fnr family transcriptional regulator [Quisquiliibacterium sp.]HPA89082.1 Crp/Fnr family transcriptional regulator [Quisquiliibacterium sp.]HQN12121.1 Crp/Fnr family transcriptional regulator [Quisquiliibacterium sp.]HQP65926.1 Crp/Fnr family transcriptional regulator [Quisquiliibacterium sp.]